ncbi:hypothetical protein PC9H_008157 [Pleurotus ostreatus]|uniref:Uncharacterized protein n=1 Tax=Pleurotus ostreatus TaxID=5322 RepID=A0A8H6ZVA2_PLEOS|nr:uncharacterized protein PC9H_008157 [Pleurotus ostreatus]KAF7428921.1 hypothetical protein PC9H_008157 [Pleurotus ostreatus]
MPTSRRWWEEGRSNLKDSRVCKHDTTEYCRSFSETMTSSTRGRSRSHRRREKARERSQDGDRERNIRKRGRSRSRSVSSSSSSSSDHKRRKRKKDKHRKRHGSKERKEKKKSKKSKKSGGEKPHWGKYGIITESDMFNKASEFHTWLVEERKINPETVSKDQNKKEFSRFVEDYNTATLPHEKYYNMEAYDRRMAALRAGEYVPPQNDSYDPNADMRALQGVHKRKVIEQDTYLSKEQLQELRKVQQERIQASKMKSMGMDVPQTMGVRMDGSMFDE